ncbi:MAG: NAD-dependent epimerase/dehydratase family protein [Acidimicrobiia bacterium]|nr:NAD-dependent epimerase/dehydratase family protein [Acidimicrobiia bacterium]
MARVLIAGCGYAGIALGMRLAREGHVVWGLRRRPELLPAMIHPLKGDLFVQESLPVIPAASDFVFYTAAAARADDASYSLAYVTGIENLLRHLVGTGQTPKRIFFTSSTAVYAQTGGEWVDETSDALPCEFSGRRLLEGEQLLSRGPFPATVVRMAGIYGPGRTRLIEQALRGEWVLQPARLRYSNRIHRDDCAGVLRHLMLLRAPTSLYLGSDDEPSDQSEVLRWLAKRLEGVLSAPQAHVIANSGGPRSNKRCRNLRLKQSGYSFLFPTFREGYESILAGMDLLRR